uniref:Elongation factor 1-alpha isoform X1 n=1 Tax=Rhizophora mucronata TaxID=61149 RepID=A0A2P2LQN9_RHIMU
MTKIMMTMKIMTMTITMNMTMMQMTAVSKTMLMCLHVCVCMYMLSGGLMRVVEFEIFLLNLMKLFYFCSLCSLSSLLIFNALCCPVDLMNVRMIPLLWT